MAVLWTCKPIQQILFKILHFDTHLERSADSLPLLFAAVFFRVAKTGQSTYATQQELTMNCWSKADHSNL